MNNTYKSQMATLEDDNAENEKMPQNSKIWIPPAKVRFLEKKVISFVLFTVYTIFAHINLFDYGNQTVYSRK